MSAHSSQLVVSLFPGIGMLDMAFEEAGFCVVRGPDVLWGGDIRRFRPPCQCFSRLAHMVRHKGYEPRFGNLIPEFERVVREAKPKWYLMENVPDAPLPDVPFYGRHSFLLNNRQLGEAQNRVRRWSFGYRGAHRSLMVETQVFESAEYEYAAVGAPVALGGTGKQKRTSRLPGSNRSKSGFRELCKAQGVPDDYDLPAFTVKAKCHAIANGVPMAMGRAIADAVRRATVAEDDHDATE